LARSGFIGSAAWAPILAFGLVHLSLAAVLPNNAVTYRDRKLRGLAWFAGWLTFVLACSIGAAANVGIAEFLFERNQWWAMSAIAGILIGAVWNYAVTSTYTWHAT
jgi:dolichol-phosphate mannosyltransferase